MFDSDFVVHTTTARPDRSESMAVARGAHPLNPLAASILLSQQIRFSSVLPAQSYPAIVHVHSSPLGCLKYFGVARKTERGLY